MVSLAVSSFISATILCFGRFGSGSSADGREEGLVGGRWEEVGLVIGAAED